MDFKKTEPMTTTTLTGTDPALLVEGEAGLETASDPGEQAKEGDDFDYGFFVRALAETEEHKKKPRPRLCDEEEIRRLNVLEAEGKGVWVTVGEFSGESGISRSLIKKKIRQGRLKVKKIPYQGSKTGFRYMVWVENPWLKGKVLIARRNRIVEMNVTHSMLATLHKMSKINDETYNKILSNEGTKFTVTFVVPVRTLHDLFKNSVVHHG